MATQASANLTPDIASMADLTAAITAHIAIPTDASGNKPGGVVARLVKTFNIDTTIELPGSVSAGGSFTPGAEGFVLLGSPWARLIIPVALTTLFSIKCKRVRLIGVVAAPVSGVTLTTFVAASSIGSEMVVDGCDATATNFLTIAALTGGKSSIRSNHTRGGLIDTSASGGQNVIMGNFETTAGATITSNASDAVGLNT